MRKMGGGGKNFFSAKKKGAGRFFIFKKRRQPLYPKEKRGEVFFTDLKMGGQYFFATNRGASDLFCHFSSHIFPNRSQCIEISKIEEIGASAFLIG